MPERIIVAGIYRSGTSLNSELVHRWGAYVGRKDDIFQDEYGYLEHLALQKLNDELLDNNSYVPTPVEQMREKAQEPTLQERALEILDAMDKEAEENLAIAWVWKDPRLPLVLPFWASLWGDVIYVIPVRHPVETIRSGANMDGLDPDAVPLSAGFAYWQFCMLNVLTFTESSRRKLFIAYDQLLKHPQRECTRLCHFLDEQCGVSPQDAEQRIDSMTSQIATDKHHFQHPKPLADVETTTREQRVMYNFLRVKTMYPDETFNKDDFALYPGWLEYLQMMNMIASFADAQES
jgi:hypothetical protein